MYSYVNMEIPLSIIVFLVVAYFFGASLVKLSGRVFKWIALVLVLVTSVDVFLRYFFNSGSVALQEAEWHLYSALFLLTAGFVYLEDKHVRVDVFYSKFSPKKKRLIEVLGILFFLLPFCFLLIWSSVPFVSRAFQMSEISADPGGLKFRFLVKSLIPFGAFLLAMSGVVKLRELLVLKESREGSGIK